jgi:predicted acylesterase/phospholipase RssA
MKYTNLVIGGGGLNGYYFLGTLKYLYENNLLDIKKILGVSIGSVIAYLLIIGYDIQFLIDILLKINIQKYVPEINLDTILDEYYLFDNTKFNKFIEYLTKKKNIDINITLSELYQKTKIDFIIGTVNISDHIYEYVSHTTYPNLNVLTALKMSYAIPLLFKPVIHNNMFYIDGAVMNNFPIKYFKKDIKNTIGISITTKENNIYDIFSYFKNVMKTITHSKYQKQFSNNIILIYPIIDLSLYDVISVDNLINIRQNMIDIGYKTGQDFFKNKYDFIKNIVLDIIDKI